MPKRPGMETAERFFGGREECFFLGGKTNIFLGGATINGRWHLRMGDDKQKSIRLRRCRRFF